VPPLVLPDLPALPPLAPTFPPVDATPPESCVLFSPPQAAIDEKPNSNALVIHFALWHSLTHERGMLLLEQSPCLESPRGKAQTRTPYFGPTLVRGPRASGASAWRASAARSRRRARQAVKCVPDRGGNSSRRRALGSASEGTQTQLG
jgi:hypothetical protein